MQRILKALMLAVALVLALPPGAQARPIPVDAPELAPRGPLPVGFTSMVLADPDRAEVLRKDAAGGYAHATRRLPIKIWYPAIAAARKVQHIVYAMPSPFLAGLKTNPPPILHFDGQAARDASPAAGRFPLVVFSHGYNNHALGFSHLAENLASKGYVVVSIEHHDPDPALVGSRQASFAVVLVDRSADQRFVIAQIQQRAAAAHSGVFAHIDTADMALAGYSMGGYGAIATAGAGYDPNSPIFKLVPPALFKGSMESDDKPVKGLKALILFGPWGGSPATRMWTPAALANIAAPALVIDGSQDDIADYTHGVSWLFDQMANSNRYLLTYREARHNIAMNAAPPSVASNYIYIDKYDEPVWRKDRILAINAHMITAFLDWHLKGIANRASYLDVPTPASDDGTWPLAKGQVAGSSVAQPTGDTAGYWRGFHRRWALGLELQHKGPASH